jgi:hypothetical protein
LVSRALQCFRVVHLTHLCIVRNRAEPQCSKNLHHVERHCWSSAGIPNPVRRTLSFPRPEALRRWQVKN